MPQISVIMPAYNAAKYIREAVDSILKQTFEDFELIVVDDCSSDETPQILASYDDPRLRVIRNEQNMERSFSKNRGIAEAKAELIAFLDADDHSVPERLQTQFDFLAANPDIALCSCFFKIMESGVVRGYVTSPADVKAELLLSCPIGQSGVMLRKAVLNQLDEIFRDAPIPSEDYDLWARFSCLPNVKIAVIPDALVYYRLVNTANVYFEKQRLGASMAYKTQLEAFGLQPTPEHFSVHCLLAGDAKIQDPSQLYKGEQWLIRILKHNRAANYYNQASLERAARKAWLHFCHRSSRVYLRTFFVYYASSFSNKGIQELKASFRMLLKFFCFLLFKNMRKSVT